jgi:hypothetical protein
MERTVALPARPRDPRPRESGGTGRRAARTAPPTRTRGTSYALVKTAWMVMRLFSDIMFSLLNDMP